MRGGYGEGEGLRWSARELQQQRGVVATGLTHPDKKQVTLSEACSRNKALSL
jgi:hypothetical protein